MSPSAAERVRTLAAAHGLEPGFSPEVAAEALAVARAPGADDPLLVDARAVPYLTIDNPTSKDLDQAMAIRKDGPEWVVSYAIADASHHVARGTALHAEALRRGATVYLPGLVTPMIPVELSEGATSLLPDVDRRAVVFEIRVDASGACGALSVSRCRIRSRLKTAYAWVQQWVDGGAPPTEDRAALQVLEGLAGVGEALARHASGLGVVRVRRDEVAVDIGDGGQTFVALRERRGAVERWNEQISLLTNREAAAWLGRVQDPGVQPIYRVMAPPDAEALAALSRAIRRIAGAHGRPWSWGPADGPLASFLDGLPDDRVAHAIHRQAMLVGGRAAYAATPGPHAGVGASVYGRFTAPMREMVGVFLHAELCGALAGSGSDPRRIAADEVLRDQVLASASRARSRQRDLDHALDAMVLDDLFGQDLRQGRTRTATVMGLGGDKVHLLLDDPPIDAKWYHAHAHAQVGGRVRADPDGITLLGPSGPIVAVGDGVDVAVRSFDPDRKRWELAVTRRLGPSAAQ